jgi:hypothetical protein
MGTTSRPQTTATNVTTENGRQQGAEENTMAKQQTKTAAKKKATAAGWRRIESAVAAARIERERVDSARLAWWSKVVPPSTDYTADACSRDAVKNLSEIWRAHGASTLRSPEKWATTAGELLVVYVGAILGRAFYKVGDDFYGNWHVAMAYGDWLDPGAMIQRNRIISDTLGVDAFRRAVARSVQPARRVTASAPRAAKSAKAPARGASRLN